MGLAFRCLLAGLWGLALTPDALVLGQESAQEADGFPFQCEVRYVTTEGVFVNVGTEQRIADGLMGWLFHKERRVGRVEVRAATKDSSFLVFVNPLRSGFPQADDTVTLVMDRLAELPEVVEEEPQEEPEFVPLLTPEEVFLGVGEPRSVWHGRLSLRHLYQETSDGLLDYHRTTLDSSGTGERIDGTPWSLDWNTRASYRTGEGLSKVRDHEDVRLEVYGLSLSRRFDDNSFLRVGRFLPRALPSIGFLDGVVGEKVLTERWRGGVAFGFKPDHDDLGLTIDEPTLVPYVSYHNRREDSEFSVTSGLLVSTYEGSLDRMALLVDQTARHGRMSLYSSAELDLDVGVAETHSGPRLTRGDLAASFLMDGWTPSMGIGRYEPLDTDAERDLVNTLFLDENEYFEDGYWRAFVGAGHQLSSEWSLNEQLSFTKSQVDDSLHWRIGVTKSSFLGMAGARTSLTVYNLSGLSQEGYGARAVSYLPLPARHLTLQPSLTFRWVEFDTGNQAFEFADGSITMHWHLRPRLDLFGGGSYSASDSVRRLALQLGVTWRF